MEFHFVDGQGPTRREFLAGAAVATAGLLSRPGIAVSQGSVDAGWIDAHSHIWTRDLAQYPLAAGQSANDLKPPSFTAEGLLALVRPLGVSRVVLIQHRPYHGVDNRYLEDAIREYPGVFGGVACIDASAPHPAIEMVRLARAGFRGFRITPDESGGKRWSEHEGIRSMWAAAPALGVSICPLIGPDFLGQIDEMCRLFPDTSVVIDHFARIGGDGTIRDEDVGALCGLKKHPHAHVKTSAFYFLVEKRPPYRGALPLFRRVFETFGPACLMWGSDSPYQLAEPNSYAASLEFIQKTADFLTSDDRVALLRTTAQKVFFPRP
jgi:predicted TIM-barrel fold metal-dependent hydrolase